MEEKNYYENKKKVGEVYVEEVELDIGGLSRELELVVLADIHFNIINDRDREENNELVMASYNDPVLWLKDGKSVRNLNNCLEYAKNADQIVIVGDTMSYLSYGNIELMKKHIFDRFPEIMVCVGNHDPLRSWRGKVKEYDTLMERAQVLQDNWIHDIYYYSKVIDDRVMLIQMDNAIRCESFGVEDSFWDRQVEPFAADLALAREKGYAVLLFYHIPISTGKPEDEIFYPKYGFGDQWNYYSGEIIGSHSKGASKTIYDMIINNADIIKATFCGHMHADYYTEIKAKTADGKDSVIPQYIVQAVPYERGHVLKATVK